MLYVSVRPGSMHKWAQDPPANQKKKKRKKWVKPVGSVAFQINQGLFLGSKRQITIPNSSQVDLH